MLAHGNLISIFMLSDPALNYPPNPISSTILHNLLTGAFKKISCLMSLAFMKMFFSPSYVQNWVSSDAIGRLRRLREMT